MYALALRPLRCSLGFFFQTEKRFQCKLQDMKNQLEQVNSAKRSLQNYVHYLKASYANVFGDSALTSSLNTDHK